MKGTLPDAITVLAWVIVFCVFAGILIEQFMVGVRTHRIFAAGISGMMTLACLTIVLPGLYYLWWIFQ